MSALRFDVLGPLRVTRDGREVELGPARRRAALAALLVDAGRTVPAETLVDRVWDAAPTANAQASLHSYVSRLRAALRDPDAPAGADPVLVTAPPGYRLDADRGAIDAERFDIGLTAARARFATGDLDGARDVLDDVLALWRGEPYADVAVPFVGTERTRLRARRDTARELRAQVASTLGDHDRAVDELTALVAEHPLREPLHAALMLALYRAGRSAEALQHFAVAGERLADELGVDPGAELRELHTRILREDPSLTPTVSATTPTPGGTAPVRPETVRSEPAAPAAAAMIGRDAELARALATIDATWTTGAASAVVLVGEAGIGKSRLAEEIAARAAAGGAHVVWSRTWQHGDAPVLHPWVQAIRRIAAVVGPEVTAAALVGRAAPLAALVPELAGAAVDEPAGDTRSGEQVQVQLFEAVEAFLRVAAEGRRIVVVLEDLHWADAASHRLTEYLLGHTDGVPVALVAAVRSPVDAGGRVPDLLAAFARTARTTRVDLGGLGVADVRRYVADRTGGDLDEPTATALVERTGGNPFFVGELVALFSDVASGGDASMQVPTSVRDVVRRRVADLGDDTGRVLATASLMGRTFDLDLLERASGLDGDVVDEAVDLATSVGLLCSEPGAPGLHRFTHALVADAVAETVGPARRQRQHARTADVLEARLAGGGVVATGQLVHHLVATADPQRIERAVELCCEEGARARRRHDLGEAEASLLTAVELTARLAPGPGERWELTARNRLGALYVLMYGAHHPDAVAQRRRSQELLAGSGAAREIAILQAHRWAEAMMVADFRATRATVEEIAATAAAADDDLVRACAEAAAGEVSLHRGRPREALTRLDEACRLLATVGAVPTDFAVALPSPPPAWFLWRDMAKVVLGELEDLPADAVEQALGEARRDLQLAAFVHGPIAVVACVRDDPAAALAPAEICVDLAERAGLAHLGTYYRSMAGWARVRLATAPVPGAVEDMLADIGLFDAWPAMLMRPFHLGLCADALLSLGRPAEAAPLLDRAVEETLRTDNAQLLAETHRNRAIAWSRLGRPESEVAGELATAASVAADQGALLFGRRIAGTAAELGIQLPSPSSSSAANADAAVDDIAGFVTR